MAIQAPDPAALSSPLDAMSSPLWWTIYSRIMNQNKPSPLRCFYQDNFLQRHQKNNKKNKTTPIVKTI